MALGLRLFPETTMSQNKLENGSAGAVPVRIALRPDASPANDTACALPGAQPGPLGLSRTYWMLWCGMLLNRLGGTIFLLLGLYLTRERGLSPELAGRSPRVKLSCLFRSSSSLRISTTFLASMHRASTSSC